MNWAGELLFGESWAIYSGTAAHNTPHAHAAVQVVIGIDADVVVLSSDGTEYRGRAMVVRPLVQHSLVATAEVVILYVEPQSPLAFMIADQIGDADIAQLDPGRLLFEQSLATTAWANLLAALTQAGVDPVDSRLKMALMLLSEEPGQISIADAALAADLSESRLRALARIQLGLPLSTWLIWRKLDRAARALKAGSLLAEAALVGGFADQAHLARAMRRMFGITPRTAQKVGTIVKCRSVQD